MGKKVALRQKLRKLDFQALEIFYHLYTHQSVTEVAEILFLSQSSVSYSLKRLRAAFDDELFISSKGGMKPTPKSESIIKYIEDILNKISLCVDEKQYFLPKEYETTFTIFSPEYFEILVIPLLIEEILKEGLKIKIDVVRPETKIPFEEIKNRQIDIGIVLKTPGIEYPNSLCSQSILHDELLAVFGGDIAQPEGQLTIEELVHYKQVFPSPWLENHCMVDSVLKKQNIQRNVTIKANGYYSGLKMLTSSEMMMLLPHKIYHKLSNQHASLHCRKAPKELLGFDVDMLWSETSSNDPANQWLRKQIILACQKIGEG